MSARKQIHYRGKTLAELLEMPLDELVQLLPSRQRRSLMRPEYWTSERSKLLGKLRDAKEAMASLDGSIAALLDGGRVQYRIGRKRACDRYR